jgi:hypothetical protein
MIQLAQSLGLAMTHKLAKNGGDMHTAPHGVMADGLKARQKGLD